MKRHDAEAASLKLAETALALHAFLPAADRASRRRQSLAVHSSARDRIAAGTSAPGAGAFGRGVHIE